MTISQKREEYELAITEKYLEPNTKMAPLTYNACMPPLTLLALFDFDKLKCSSVEDVTEQEIFDLVKNKIQLEIDGEHLVHLKSK